LQRHPDPRAAARHLVADVVVSRKRIPGFGHRIHAVDPRQAVLFDLARRYGIAGKGVAFAEAVREEFAASGRTLPVNVDGAIAAILYDLGLPSHLGKAVFIMGRVAGVAAHVVEELSRERPMRFRFSFAYDGPEPPS
ncbi:MAG: citryl-CoA lyase, partial [Armatimonadetes bacterium]|nr:citryl-CoA lyase [Armatimonadota bacterium]